VRTRSVLVLFVQAAVDVFIPLKPPTTSEGAKAALVIVLLSTVAVALLVHAPTAEQWQTDTSAALYALAAAGTALNLMTVAQARNPALQLTEPVAALAYTLFTGIILLLLYMVRAFCGRIQAFNRPPEGASSAAVNPAHRLQLQVDPAPGAGSPCAAAVWRPWGASGLRRHRVHEPASRGGCARAAWRRRRPGRPLRVGVHEPAGPCAGQGPGPWRRRREGPCGGTAHPHPAGRSPQGARGIGGGWPGSASTRCTTWWRSKSLQEPRHPLLILLLRNRECPPPPPCVGM
jgi:hypothetical protein